jgi:hypothetical protein
MSGEIVKADEIQVDHDLVSQSLADANAYHEASTLKLTDKESKALLEPVKDEEVDIRPDGLIYYSHVYVRDRLNQIIGIGQWALIEHGTKMQGNAVFFSGSLYIRGKFVAKAMGEQDYHANNPKESYASAYEGAKSDCLVRCCKDLGIGKECWQRSWSSKWVQKYGVKVFVKKNDKTSVQWRHVDSQPFWNESGAVPDSPNKPKFTNDTPPEQRKEDFKQPVAPTQKKALTQKEIKEEADKCKRLNDLDVLFRNKLTPEQQKNKNIIKIFKERKAGLSQPEKTDIPTLMIQALKSDSFDRDIVVIEEQVENEKSAEKKRMYLAMLNTKLFDIGKHEYVPNITPF